MVIAPILPITLVRKYTNCNLTTRAVTVWTFSNITAGSDSTAVVLRTIFHNLLAHPESKQRLMEELETAQTAGQLSMPCTWKEVRVLPYLDACVKEAIRLHPPFGLPLERVIPVGGATICGQFFEEGTVVGMSAWVSNRHKPTFGEDVHAWRPERWLCDEPVRKVMEAAILTVRLPNGIWKAFSGSLYPIKRKY
jgi:cytochrome P450